MKTSLRSLGKVAKYTVCDNGYYLFFESRYFIPAEKATVTQSVSIVSLKHYFFDSYNQAELSDQLSNVIIQDSLRESFESLLST